jgi:predicted nucleotide-binding protein
MNERLTMEQANFKNKRILLVDDDRSFNRILAGKLRKFGFTVNNAYSVKNAIEMVKKEKEPFDIALIDIFIPEYSQESEDDGLNMGGLILADELCKISPYIKLIGMTCMPGMLGEGIRNKFDQYFEKPLRDDDVAEITRDYAENIKKSNPNIFIVHGHDNAAKYELKNYLQNTLNLGNPKILHELPSRGRMIIEKFEEETRHVDLVFALLTPDDKGAVINSTNNEKRRARQNVIFELGYFFAKLQRTSGKIILLSKGKLELPSDIRGIIYIDISNGIEAAGEEIRREILEWL